MNANETLDLIARILVIIGVPAGAIFALYRTVILPARLAKDASNQKHQQETEGGAFRQVLKINESLVDVLVGLYREIIGQIDKLEKAIAALQIIRAISDAKTQVEIHNREWARMEEILSDIDITMHKIEAGQALIIEALTNRDNEH